MVDTAIELEARGHRGPILALSRRGLAPRRHDGAPHAQAPCAKAADVPLSRRLAALRRRSREAGWRVAFDEQRGSVQAVWRAASDRQRRQFLRHLRPWWDVHRHRMAPEVADWLERHPRLSIVAGRLRSATVDGDFVKAVCRPRGSAGDVSVRVARIVNCSGFGADISRTRDRLLRGLIETGAVRIDPLDLGLDVDVEGRVLDACSRPDPALWAIGPITRGALWEITAVPDIRAQVASVAAALVASLGMEATVAARGSARLGSETIHTTF